MTGFVPSLAVKAARSDTGILTSAKWDALELKFFPGEYVGTQLEATRSRDAAKVIWDDILRDSMNIVTPKIGITIVTNESESYFPRALVTTDSTDR